MVELVSFEESMERLVRFVEETTPDTIVEQTVEKLDQGESAERLLKAAGLAVSRSMLANAARVGIDRAAIREAFESEMGELVP